MEVILPSHRLDGPDRFRSDQACPAGRREGGLRFPLFHRLRCLGPRQKIDDLLVLARVKNPGVPELRKAGARIVPAQSHSTLTLADGANHECFIVDMSVAGAAVSAQLRPPVGTPLAIGACVGRVVRHFSTGFAVKFVEKQNQHSLDRLIVRPIPTFSAAGARV